jgi:MoaA/NifB/PqqE/SkfB family radical SAM enzyme
MGKKRFDLNQGVSGGRYSILKAFHYPKKVAAMLEGRVTAPLYVRVKPTNRCNHSCVWCVYDPKFSTIHSSSNRTDEIPIDKMTEILGDFKTMGVQAVTYSGGGEPLVHPNIAEILKGTLDRNIRLSMITNGQALQGEAAELLLTADWVRVSLDYHDADLFAQTRRMPKKMFDVVRENVTDFAMHKSPDCDLGVNCVVSHLNYKHLKDIAELCKDMGVDNLRFAPVWKRDFLKYHAGFKDEAMAQIEQAKELADKRISIGSTYERYFERSTAGDKREYPRCFYMEMVPVIAADQGVYTCHNNAYEPAGKIGSIKHQSFRRMWASRTTAEFFKGFKPGKVCTHECSNDEKNRILNEFATCNQKGVVEYI